MSRSCEQQPAVEKNAILHSCGSRKCQATLACLHASLVTRPAGLSLLRSGVQDVFDMMQSSTFVMQLGYGILEILCVNIFPEMKSIFRGLEAGDL